MRIVILAALLFLIAVPVVYAASCVTSSEAYAVEVVVPDYNSRALVLLGSKSDSIYVTSSHYSQNLLSLVRENSEPRGLSIRLQRPTEAHEIERPHLKFVSSSSGSVRAGLPPTFNGWRIECAASNCVFDKDFVRIETDNIGGETDVSVEINQELADCSSRCTGQCISAAATNKCIDGVLKNDFDRILVFTNASSSLNSLLQSYRIVGSDKLVISDISPTFNAVVDWKEAMREELVFLSNQGIISLNREEIEQIAGLSEEGQAGKNYRIVFDNTRDEWKYSDDLPGAIFSSELDCRAYQLPSSNSGNGEANVFYLVPLFILIGGCAMLLVLILVAKLMSRGKKKKTN